MKQNSKQKTTAILLLSILAVSMVIVLSNTFMTTEAQTTNTTIPSNLLQYDYGQANGNSSRSFASDGPGPNSFNIAWKTHIPGVISQPIAIGGRILVQDNSVYFGNGNYTYCLDAGTGQILWKIKVVGSVIKLDNNYILIGSNAYKLSDGSLAWTAPKGFAVGAGVNNGLTQLMGIGYDASRKTYYTTGPLAAWVFTDVSQPPTMLWSRANQPDYSKYGYETACAEADGIIAMDTSYNYVMGVNATTGATIWAIPTTISSWTYGMSIENGVLGFGSLNGVFYGWNLTTGEQLWTYNPNTPYLNQFASSPGAAYGMFYEHNQDNSVYAINATTGQLVWSASGPGVAYSNILTIAGGKVYLQMGENQYQDAISGKQSRSEFDCFDAYNGTLIWSAPVENSAPFNSQCNAYGNLYIVPMVSTFANGTFTYSYSLPSGGITGGNGALDEIWCISDTPQDWPMQYNDAEHSSFGNGPTNVATDWAINLDGGMVSSPTLVNGVAYVGTYVGTIYAVDATDGTRIWNYSTGIIGFSSTLAVVNSKVYTGAENGTVRCLDATKGTLLWATDVGNGKSTGSPIVTNGNVYVGTANGLVYCIDAYSGSTRWTYNTTGSISVAPTIDVTSKELYIPATLGSTGYLFKLNADTGAQIYNVTIPGGSISSPATLGDGINMVFVRSNYLRNYGLNATSGAIIWTYTIGVNSGTPQQATGISQNCAILYQYGRVYLTDFFGITCLNAFNGTQIWSTYLARQNNAPGLSCSYGRIYYVNENGALYVLDSLTGQKLSYYQFNGGGTQLHSIPTPYHGKLYVSTLTWQLVCLKEAPVAQVSSTTIAISVESSSITIGQPIVVTGTLSGQSTSTQITVTIAKPDSSTPIGITATTDTNGNFKVTYLPEITGQWSVVASYNGDTMHNAAASQVQTVTVTESVTPTPTQTQQSMADLYFIPAVVAIIIAIIVVGLATIFALRKRP